MNHLAHAWLAGIDDVEFALGSALGDFVHGPPDTAWHAARQAGLRFHRAIDHYTDAHPEVVAARQLFQPPLRRYAGIMLDVWFDGLLVAAWPRLLPAESVDDFCTRWLALLDTHAAVLPESFRRFIAFMHAHALPAAYGDPATLDLVFHAMARRFSHPSPLGDALPALQARADELQRHFDAFWPDLVAHARRSRAESGV